MLAEIFNHLFFFENYRPHFVRSLTRFFLTKKHGFYFLQINLDFLSEKSRQQLSRQAKALVFFFGWWWGLRKSSHQIITSRLR